MNHYSAINLVQNVDTENIYPFCSLLNTVLDGHDEYLNRRTSSTYKWEVKTLFMLEGNKTF